MSMTRCAGATKRERRLEGRARRRRRARNPRRLDPDRLLASGITAGDVNRQPRATQVDVAGGRGEIGGRGAIRTLAGKQTIEDLAKTMIALPGGRAVRLDTLGTITDSIEEPRSYAELDGEPVVAFSITRSKGASDVAVAEGVAKKLEELRRAYPNVEIKQIDLDGRVRSASTKRR